MSLESPTNWLIQAQKEGWALGAFNANNFEQAQAIVQAAQIEKTPIILQFSHRALIYLGNGNSIEGIRIAGKMGEFLSQSVDVPISLHLDHGTEIEINQAVSLGFTSVMFDGSSLPFKENLAKSIELCKITHEKEINFEAELGSVAKPINDKKSEVSELTDLDFVAEFVEKTHLDSLAVSIGSSHGGKYQHVSLNLPLLNSIRKLVKVPLVLHGSSGVTDESLSEGIKRGLSKINYATQLNIVFTQTIMSYLEKYRENPDPRKYLNNARNAVVEKVRERIVVIGSSNRFQR